MNRYYQISIIGLMIVIIFLTTCSKSKVIKEILEKENIVHVKDTTIITIIDTFYFYKRHYNLPIYIHDTTFVDSYNTLPQNTYTSTVNDSLLDALITVKSSDVPRIDFEYQMKHFRLNESTTITDSVYLEKEINRSYMSLGATLLGSKNNFGFAPLLQYNRKINTTYSLGYDVINSNLHFSFSKRISFRRR